ncbi:Rho-type GTPase-activating protein 1 [Rhodotorula toruloides]|nr:Rho-type GTPase-activating protein 1 [Rhodotorula toruloides]
MSLSQYGYPSSRFSGDSYTDLHSLPSLRLFRSGRGSGHAAAQVLSPGDTEDDEPGPGGRGRDGIFSRRARSASRSSRARERSRSLSLPRARTAPVSPPSDTDAASDQSDPSSPLSPSSPFSPSALDHPLFAPTFTPRQLARLQRSSLHAQKREKDKAKHAHAKGERKAELRIAMGVLELVESEKKVGKEGRKRGRSASMGRDRTVIGGQAGGAGAAQATQQPQWTKQDGLFGMLEQVEHQLESRFDVGPHPAAPSTPPSASNASNAKEGVKRLAEAGGAAALISLVGAAGVDMWRKRKEEKARRGSVSAATQTKAAEPTSRPSSTPAVAALVRPRSSSVASAPAGRAAPPVSRPPSIPHPFAPPTPNLPPAPYLSSLTPVQHHLVRHAAAALLLKDHRHGRGVFEGIERVLERMWERGEEVGYVHGGGKGRPVKLFGTPLKYLTKHEGVDSFHGANPHGTVRIPEFVDHCITALKMMDMTTEGILRKSGKFRVVNEIINALDSSGGNDTVIDLAALDPITLADLFKRFLAALPDPVLTGHLFNLFIACSHIKNVGIRRRAMHLVICLMPRANRDVMEVIFLFLDWLSTFAHITVKDGNKMELTSIAKIMAPTLLRPLHRPPHPHEVPSMISSVLLLLEDQHLLHSVPVELAQVLHIEVPKEHLGKKGAAESGGLVAWLEKETMDPSKDMFEDTGMLDDPADDDYAPPGGSRSTASPKSRASKSNKGSPTTPSKGKGRERRKSAEPAAQPKRNVPFPLFDLPGEIIDAISYSPILRVHDHLRLAATCRSLRSAYYTPPPSGKGFASFSSPIWKALTKERNFESLGKNRYYYGNGAYSYGGGQSKEESDRILKHLWSREDRIDPDKMLVLAQKTVAGRKGRGGVVMPSTVVVQPVRSVEWDDVIATLSTQRITKTNAKSEYKLNDSDYRERRNPHYRSAAPMQLYLEIAVETLAFRLHGGYAGHVALLKKRESAAAKAAQTKRAKLDGTWVSPKKKTKVEQEQAYGDEGEDDEHIFSPPSPPAFGAFPATPAFGGAVAAGTSSLSHLFAPSPFTQSPPPSSSSAVPSHLAGFIGLQPASTSTLPALPALQQPYQPHSNFTPPAAPVAGPSVIVKPDPAPMPLVREAGTSTATSTPPDAKLELKREEEEEPNARFAPPAAAEVDVKPEIKPEETDEAEEGGRRTSRRRGAKRSYKQYADGGFDVFE